MEELFPAQEFRRITGTEVQDTVANNGQMIREMLTLSPKEGLFLIRNN